MSMTITLVPIVIALGSTLSTASLAALCKGRNKKITDLQTGFADRELLLNTLNEHGLNAVEKNDDHIVVLTSQGELHYERTAEGSPYVLNACNVHNVAELMEELVVFEEEYGRNVQAYTYNRIMESLSEHGLVLQEEEVAEDDTIVLTLSV